VMEAAGGGGFGDPFGRDAARVEADVREGYVTVEGARRDYGVALDPATGKLDRAATDALRRHPRKA